MSINANSPSVPRSEPISTPPRKSPKRIAIPLIPGLSLIGKEFYKEMMADIAELNSWGHYPNADGVYPNRYGRYPKKAALSPSPTTSSMTYSGDSCFSSRMGSLGSSLEGMESQGSYSLNRLFDEPKTIESKLSADLATDSSKSQEKQATASDLVEVNKENSKNQDLSSEKDAKKNKTPDDNTHDPFIFEMEI